jgi:signal transduction histidine kinase
MCGKESPAHDAEKAYPALDAGRVSVFGTTPYSDTDPARGDDSMKGHRVLSPDARRQLRDASRIAAVERTSAAIVDDLNQPLGAIALCAEASFQWLARENPNVPEAIDAIQGILRSVQRASRIAQGIRSLVVKSDRE